MPEYPMDLGEWLEQHDGMNPEIITEGGGHFLIVPFKEDDGGSDAYALSLENLSGEVHNVGGE